MSQHQDNYATISQPMQAGKWFFLLTRYYLVGNNLRLNRMSGDRASDFGLGSRPAIPLNQAHIT